MSHPSKDSLPLSLMEQCAASGMIALYECIRDPRFDGNYKRVIYQVMMANLEAYEYLSSERKKVIRDFAEKN